MRKYCSSGSLPLDYEFPYKTLMHLRQKIDLKKDIDKLINLGQTRESGILQILIGNNVKIISY